MAWPEKRVDSWAYLAKVASEVAKAGSGSSSYLCRGQPDASHDLRPSLVRLLSGELDRAKALEAEKRAVEMFKAEAHLHLPQSWLPAPLPEPALAEWWALMQHYSAPTRLLDWTASLYAAAYFAVSARWDCDGAVYLFQGNAFLTGTNERYGEQTTFINSDFLGAAASSRLTVWTPTRKTDRMVAQQGSFTVALDVLADHGNAIDDILAPLQAKHAAKILYLRLVIPAKLKPEFMLQLRQMNIASHSLFPGPDGLGRSVCDLLRVARAVAELGPTHWAV